MGVLGEEALPGEAPHSLSHTITTRGAESPDCLLRLAACHRHDVPHVIDFPLRELLASRLRHRCLGSLEPPPVPPYRRLYDPHRRTGKGCARGEKAQLSRPEQVLRTQQTSVKLRGRGRAAAPHPPAPATLDPARFLVSALATHGRSAATR